MTHSPQYGHRQDIYDINQNGTLRPGDDKKFTKIASVSTRSYCVLVLKINKLIKKFGEKTQRDPGHCVRIHIVKMFLGLFLATMKWW